MFLGIFLGLAAAFSHSISFVSRKRGLEEADYKLFILVRLVLGVALSGTLLWTVGNGFGGLTLKVTAPFALSGAFAGGLGALISTTLAIHHIGASRAHSITSASPLVTAFVEIVFLGAILSLPLILGTILVVIGAALISFFLHQNEGEEDKKSTTRRPLLGLSMALYTVLAIGVQLAVHKWGLDMGATPLQGLFIHFLTASFLFAIYYVARRPDLELEKLASLRQTGSFLVGGVAMAILPLFSLFAMTHLSATVVSALMRVAPLFTVALTYFFLRGIERVNWKVGVSTCLIVTGAILVSIN